MTEFSRREVLALLAAAGAGVASSGWLADRLFAMVEEGALPTPRGPHVERWVPSLCRLCPAACGIRVRMVDDIPVGLEGNRANPISRGGLCPAGFAGLQELAHPDRIRTPLRRNGPRGSGRWTPVSWDDALGQIAASLRRLRSEERPQAFGVLAREDSALTRFWVDRVLTAFGSPNLVTDGAAETWRSALAYSGGGPVPPAPDLMNSDFILSFGHELFETDGQPVWQSKVWGRLRAPTAPSAVAMAYVGPRLSPSAVRADMWLAIRPGTEAALALGLTYVLMMEDRMDRSFLERWTAGYGGSGPAPPPGWETFEELIRTRYYPEEVSRITGAAAKDVLRLGRAFGNARRPVALLGPAPLSGGEGLPTAMAVVALNLCVGAFGRAGGYVVPGSAPLALPEPMAPDRTARRGLDAPRVDEAGRAGLSLIGQRPGSFIQNLKARRPYPLETLLIHGVNPVHEGPGGGAGAKALANVGLLVVMGTMADETAAMADLLLPEATFLETWQIMPTSPAVPIDYAGLQQPAIRPLYDSRSFEDVWFEIARRVGPPVAASVPEGSYAEWLPQAAAGLYRSGRGTLASGPYEERIAGFMESRGWRALGPGTASTFWDELKKSGAWVDVRVQKPSPADLLGPGDSHFSFLPLKLHRDLEALAHTPLPPQAAYVGRINGDAGAGPMKSRNEAFPLRILLFDTNTLRQGRTAGTPLMLEMSGFREDLAWDSWVEIHPETARRGRIREGERVRVESGTGSVTARARLTPIVPPDAVAMPRGLGHRHFGRFATGVGTNPMTLVATSVDARTGALVLEARGRVTRLRV